MSSSLYIYPINEVSLDCPITWGWLEIDLNSKLAGFLLILGGFVLNSLLVLSLYYSSRQYLFRASELQLMSIIFLIFVYSNPVSIFLSPILLVALCLIGVQYCVSREQLFLGSILFSLSMLFYAPLLWLLPLAFIMFGKKGNSYIKTTITILSGLLLPFIYVVAVRYMIFNGVGDVVDFAEKFYSSATDYSLLLSLSTYKIFEIIFFVALSVMLMLFLVSPDNRLKNLDRKMLNVKMILLFGIVTIFVLFSSKTNMPLVAAIAVPLSFLYAYRLTLSQQRMTLFQKSYSRFVEFFVIIALTALRILYFFY